MKYILTAILFLIKILLIVISYVILQIAHLIWLFRFHKKGIIIYCIDAIEWLDKETEEDDGWGY